MKKIHMVLQGKGGVGLYRRDGGRFVPLRWHVDPGRMVCYHGVYATGAREKVHLAVGWQTGAEEPWAILSERRADGAGDAV